MRVCVCLYVCTDYNKTGLFLKALQLKIGLNQFYHTFPDKQTALYKYPLDSC